MLVIDVETRSRVDLLECGSYEYAEHESTELLSLAYHIIGTECRGVVRDFKYLPLTVDKYIREGDGLVAAFNAQFERFIWGNLAPDNLQISFNRWFCVAANARVYAMPNSLNDVGKAITGKFVKDVRGPQLIRLLSVPRKDGTFLDSEALRKEMDTYCLGDVDATVNIMDALPTMSPRQHKDWLVNERINDTGICIDREIATECVDRAEEVLLEVSEKISALTCGVITAPTQHARILNFVKNRLPEHLSHHLSRDNKLSLDKSVRAALQEDPELDPLVRELLALVDETSKSSVAKFKRMLARTESGEAARGSFMYAGASQTLRFASRGLQLHNMPRECFDYGETESVKAQLLAGAGIGMGEMSKLLRPSLIPDEGNVFVVGDWSSIEARALPWLSASNDVTCLDRLALFQNGGDIYQYTADDLFNGNRQTGKVAELALGFGGAAGAFTAMGRTYKLDMDHDEIEHAVAAWREANPWAREFWNALYNAAREAFWCPNETFDAGRCKFRFYPDLLGGTLICTLPDMTTIAYPQCRLEPDPQTGKDSLVSMKAAWKPPAGQKTWPTVRLWGGFLAENVTQAICAALLRDALLRCEERGVVVVGHVHDEIISECPASLAGANVDALRRIMETKPAWALGLPIAAEPEIMKRYGK